MTEPLEPPTPAAGWKTAAIVLAIVVGIAVVIGLTLFIVNLNHRVG